MAFIQKSELRSLFQDQLWAGGVGLLKVLMGGRQDWMGSCEGGVEEFFKHTSISNQFFTFKRKVNYVDEKRTIQ